MPYHTSPSKMTRELTKEKKKKKKTKEQIFVLKKKLSKAQENILKKHSLHHTKAHIDLMKKLIMEGTSFKQAHKEAMKKHPPKKKKISK